MPPTLRIVMLGTGDFALPTFERLVETGHAVAALITQPDRPQGRQQERIPSLIKRAALRAAIPVEQPENINAPEGVRLIDSLRPDLLVTAAYGQILSPEVLAVPRLGGINLHGSILPAYRGAAPVARAIQAGEAETGVTVIRMTPRIDAGGIIAVARTPIDPDVTAGELEDRLARLGAPLIVQAVADVAAGTARVLPQDRRRVTRAPKLSKDDSPIDWTRPARAVHDHVRAMQPWPIARTVWQPAGGDRAPLPLIVHRTIVAEGSGEPGRVIAAGAGRLVVAAGSGAVEIQALQVPGKRALPAAEFLRGYRAAPGDRMASPTPSPREGGRLE